jgi:beta-lactamase superfamily II metal-dependent hydrolase
MRRGMIQMLSRKCLLVGLACITMVLVSGAAAANLTIHCLNVGQGDCTLIVSPTGGTFLFDAGENGKGNSVVAPYLLSRGFQALDYIGASHYHSDHIGGIDEVVGNLGIDSVRVAVLDRGWSYTTQTYTSYAGAVASKRATITDGQVIDLGGGVTITCIGVNGNGVLSPPFDDTYDENDLSIALLVSYLDFDFFVAGDLPGINSSLYNDIETSVALETGAVEVYQVNHHGSNSSSNAALVSALLPQVSIISTGDGNPYGHPHQPVIDRLVAYGSYIYQTEAGSGGTIPTGCGEVVDGHIVIEVDSCYYSVNVTDIYELCEDAIPISDVNEDDTYGEPTLLAQVVSIRGIATVATGTFSTTDNDIFIQDPTGGVNIFRAGNMTPTVSVGDSLKVTGLVDIYAGLTRITSPSINIEAVDVGAPDPIPVTTADIDTDGESYEGSLVKISQCAITGGAWPGEGSDGTLTIDDGSGECTLFIDKDTDIDGTTEPDTTFDLVGIATQYDPSWPYHSGYRIVPRSSDDLGPFAGVIPRPVHTTAIATVLPNPVRRQLRIAFAENVTAGNKLFTLYDTAGHKLGEAVSGPGTKSLGIDLKALCGYEIPCGIYFATITTPEHRTTVKIVIIR